MRIKILILICALLIGLEALVSMPEARLTEPPRVTAWWNLVYERPNPERLPVKVQFWLAEKI